MASSMPAVPGGLRVVAKSTRFNGAKGRTQLASNPGLPRAALGTHGLCRVRKRTGLQLFVP